MKRLLYSTAIFISAAALLSGCSGGASASEDKKALSIVTTIFPEYDWMKNLLGDNPAGAELVMLADNGVDLHSYQPSVEDLLKLSECDIFVYVGGESEEWVTDALSQAKNKDMTVIKLLDVLGDNAKEEEEIPGMQSEEHEHEGHDHDDGDHEEGPELDEHVWLSLKNAALFTESMAKALEEKDPGNASVYKANAEAYAEKLKKLDGEYAAAVKEGSVSTLLFADRFPFRYLVDDYGLTYYAAFAGCSAETEASFETIKFLAEKADELSLKTIMTTEGSSNKIAEAVISCSTGGTRKILALDSLQSVSLKAAEEGRTYLGVMEDNLKVLKEALS